MKLFTKIISMLLVLAMLLSFAACTDDSSKKDDDDDEEKTEESSKAGNSSDASSEGDKSGAAASKLIGTWEGEIDYTATAFGIALQTVYNEFCDPETEVLTEETILGIYKYLDATTALPVTFVIDEKTFSYTIDEEWLTELETFFNYVEMAIAEYTAEDDNPVMPKGFTQYIMSGQYGGKALLEASGMDAEALKAMEDSTEYTYENGEIMVDGEVQEMSLDGDTLIYDNIVLTRVK